MGTGILLKLTQDASVKWLLWCTPWTIATCGSCQRQREGVGDGEALNADFWQSDRLLGWKRSEAPASLAQEERQKDASLAPLCLLQTRDAP